MSTHFSAWFSTVALKATNKWTERKVHTNTTKFPFSASCSSAHCSKSFPFRCVRSKLIYLFPLARDLLLSHVPECVSMHPAYTQNNLFRCENKSGESQASKVQQGHRKTRQNYFSFFFLSLPPICWEKVKGTFLFRWVMAVVLVLVRRRGVLGPLRSRSRAPFSGWEIEFGTLRSNFDSRLWLLAQLAFGLCEVSLFSTVELFFGERIVIFHLPIHGGLRFGTDICGPHVSSAVFLRAGPNPNLMPNFTGSFCARTHCFLFLPLRDEFNQRS